MAEGPKGRALRQLGQPTALSLRKPGQANVNTRKLGDVDTTAKNRAGSRECIGAPVKKIGTPFNLPDVMVPPGY